MKLFERLLTICLILLLLNSYITQKKIFFYKAIIKKLFKRFNNDRFKKVRAIYIYYQNKLNKNTF